MSQSAASDIVNPAGEKAPDFTLEDSNQDPFTLSETLQKGPVLLIFYPMDFSPVCTVQLCSYRDNLKQFEDLGVQLVGISRNAPKTHAKFKEHYNISFPLLTDPKGRIAKLYKASSFLTFGALARAVYVIHPKQIILYRHIEKTIFTHRNPEELIAVIEQLKSSQVIKAKTAEA